MTRAEDEGGPPGAEAEPSRTPVLGSKRSVSSQGGAQEAGGDIHTYIGTRLRQAFDDIANQPVPDRFLQLMQDLDKA